MAKGLGKGINALFNTVDTDEETVVSIALDKIAANPFQPRKTFDEKAIQELTDSIKLHGVLQPVILREKKDGYEIVVGERRCRASAKAGLSEIPAVVRKMDDREMMELSVIENLQREDLSPLEEAESYNFLMKNLKLTQSKLAERVGKSRPYVANFIRLLSLPEEVQDFIREGALSAGHARALLALKQKKNIVPLAKKTIKDGLTVRQLEKLVTDINEDVSRETKKAEESTGIYP